MSRELKSVWLAACVAVSAAQCGVASDSEMRTPETSTNFVRDLLVDPSKETVVTKMPERFTRLGVNVESYHTHMTLTKDRQKAFLDTCFTEDGKKKYEQGLVNFKTGE